MRVCRAKGLVEKRNSVRAQLTLMHRGDVYTYVLRFESIGVQDGSTASRLVLCFWLTIDQRLRSEVRDIEFTDDEMYQTRGRLWAMDAARRIGGHSHRCMLRLSDDPFDVVTILCVPSR